MKTYRSGEEHVATESKTLPMRIVLTGGETGDIEIRASVMVTGRVIATDGLSAEQREELTRVIEGHIKLAVERAMEG